MFPRLAHRQDLESRGPGRSVSSGEERSPGGDVRAAGARGNALHELLGPHTELLGYGREVKTCSHVSRTGSSCIDAADGQRLWKGGRYGHGQMILCSDVLLVLSEQGEVVAVDPDRNALVELGRFEAVKGKTWNHAALAGRYLLVRNDRQAAMYELPVRVATPSTSSSDPTLNSSDMDER